MYIKNKKNLTDRIVIVLPLLEKEGDMLFSFFFF